MSNLASLIFWVFIGTTVVSVLAMLFLKHVFKAALSLLTCLLSLAALYVLLFAEFVAVAQILVYAGGMIVLFLFALMITSKAKAPMRSDHKNVFQGVLISVAMFALLASTFLKVSWPDIKSPQVSSIESIGKALITEYAFAFEVTGALLLITLIAASTIASTEESKQRNL